MKPSNHNPTRQSAAQILAAINDANVAVFTKPAPGEWPAWAGPGTFEYVLGLLVYGLVAIQYVNGKGLVTLTARGEQFVYNGWDDHQIVHACRRIRLEREGEIQA